MKIRDINTILIDSPGRKWTIVRVETDIGLTGLGEATYSQKEPVVAAAVDHMKQELLGEDARRIEYLWHKIYRISSESGIWRMVGPVWMSALSGIDQALWDLKGKEANLPVVDLLGGRFRDRVRLYTHFSGSDPKESALQAQDKVAAGFRFLKTGVRNSRYDGFDPYLKDRNWGGTIDHLEAVREVVGNDIDLLIDCHGRYTVSEAVKLSRALEPLDLYCFEDPLPPDDLNAYAKFKRQTAIPVMGSERLNTKTQFRQLLELDGIDIAQPDLVYAGGITEVRKIAAIADSYHVPLSFHNTKGPIGILAAAHLGASIPNEAPMEFVTGIDWRDDIITEPLEVKDGCLIISERPGFGVELNMDGIEKYLWRG